MSGRAPSKILIIGHGLVGASLAQQFREQVPEVELTVIDRSQNDSSSEVAAGLMTPITGKGMNPSPRIEEFYQESTAFFEAHACYQETDAVRLFTDIKERQKFEAKINRPDITPWLLGSLLDQGQCGDGLKDDFGGFEMKGGWVNLKKFLRQRKDDLEQSGAFLSEEVRDLTPYEAAYDLVVLSRGAFEFLEHSLFEKHLPETKHRSAKGEILTVELPSLDDTRIINRNGWLLPFDPQKNIYKAGATFEWDNLNTEPTLEGKNTILQKIKSLVDSEITVLDHQAGIRPIVRRSQPFFEPLSDKVWVANGFGSKGALYAPKATKVFVDFILKSKAIDPWFRVNP